MSSFLLVPVHLDALYLPRSRAVVEASADFRRLPYCDRQENRDVNSDTPWLGDAITAPPFENSNLTLQAGMHLHWALPDGLCHGEVDKSAKSKGQLQMPKVPDRWLIRRRETKEIGEQSWVIESNYLWPDNGHGAPAVNIFWPQPPSTADNATERKTYRPYRFLGRRQPLEDWKNAQANEANYWDDLTVLGHGDSSFAAYYPNCATVFGFHDRDLPEIWKTVHYDLMGWYSSHSQQPPLSWEAVDGGKVDHKHQWRIEDDTDPQVIVCYASIKINNGSNPHGEASVVTSSEKPPYCVALGNTISEALSAMVAQEVVAGLGRPDLVASIEEQLEALYVVDQLASEDQDLGLRLRHYRHEKSFDAVPGGTRWTVKATPPEDKALPISLTSALRRLNDLQARWDRHSQDLGQARRQLYGDWCNYMRNLYRPPDGGKGKFLDIDAVVTYIETQSLGRVEHLAGTAQVIKTALDNIRRQLEQTIDSINQANRETFDAESRTREETQTAHPLAPTQYELKAEPGARFWQPTDPVVLITGGGIRRSDRHGRDGRHDADGLLLCKIHLTTKTSADEAIRDDQSRTALLEAIDANWPAAKESRDGESKPEGSKPGDNIGCREVNVSSPPWNPLFLDWGIDLYPAAVPISQTRGVPSASPASGYNPDVITANYQLGSQYPDMQTQDLRVQDNPDRLSGRCILGDTADLILRSRIEDFLNRQLQSRLVGLSQVLEKESQNRSGLIRLIDQWLTNSPTDANARSNLRRLVEGWANLDSQNQTDHDYIQALADWYKTLADTYVQVSLAALPKTPTQLNALVDWYRQRPRAHPQSTEGQGEAADPILCTLLAYRWLFDRTHGENRQDENSPTSGQEVETPLQPRAFLSQSLSGFNGELMQWKLGMRLPIDEPIGMGAYRQFTQQVAANMGNEDPWTTEPTNQFSPLRTGALVLNKLRLIDNFGQTTEVPCREGVIVPSPYRLPRRPGVAVLPPRLVQPAQVKFRWLDADTTHPKEMVEAEAQSPICGWLLRDRLNNSLLIFDGKGNALGSLIADRSGSTTDSNPLKWVQAPGRPSLNDADCEAGRQHLQRVSPTYFASASDSNHSANQRDLGELGASIANERLARVVLYLWATKSPDFLNAFLNTLDDAMANIDPEGVTSMGSLALLTGRPVAVVGAELDLGLQQEPTVRQDWEAFRLDLFRHQRDSYEYDQVQFRLRLGQYQSRNDGILGYWLNQEGGEQTGTFAANTFVAQAASDDDPDPSLRLELDETLPGLNARINAHDDQDAVDDLNFTQSLADPPLRTTLLFDPRGKAHLSTGILPVKAIDIPRALWEPALEAIQLWLPIAPIVTSPYSRQVPHPTLVDHQWTWLEQVGPITQRVQRTLDLRPSLNKADLQTGLDKLHVDHPGHPIPTVEQLIAQGWLAESSLLGDRLYLGHREERKPLEDPAINPPLDRLLANLSLALVSPGEEPNFDPGTEVREGWLLLKPSPHRSTP